MTKVYISLALRELVIRRAKGCCEYCRTPGRYSPEVFEVEHVLPVSAGGQTTPDNLALACPACNRYKGSRQTATDPETGVDIPLFNPRAQRWQDHFRWSDDLIEIVGQTPTGRATVSLLHMNRPAVCHFRVALKALGLHPAVGD